MSSVLSLALLAVTIAQAPPAPAERAKVMVLGVYHFDDPGLDYVKGAKVDHLAPAKQAEIAEVLDRLVAFEPTKVVLEGVPGSDSLEQRYAAFREDRLEPKGDEREQLGFQLAKLLDHPRIYLADHQIGMDLGAVVAEAESSGDERFLTWFRGALGDAQALVDRQARMTVLEALVMLNEPLHQERTRDLYLQLARVGAAERFVGADVLADWYRRNFRIFANVARVIDSPADRILVVFGQGHAPYLRELVRSSPDMELVEPNAYLAR